MARRSRAPRRAQSQTGDANRVALAAYVTSKEAAYWQAALGAPAAAGEEGEPGVLKPSGGGSAGFGFGGGATDWKGAIHAKSLVEAAFSQYKSNVLLDDCASRLAIACLVTAPPAHGKSVLIGQLATHAEPWRYGLLVAHVTQSVDVPPMHVAQSASQP